MGPGKPQYIRCCLPYK